MITPKIEYTDEQIELIIHTYLERGTSPIRRVVERSSVKVITINLQYGRIAQQGRALQLDTLVTASPEIAA